MHVRFVRKICIFTSVGCWCSARMDIWKAQMMYSICHTTHTHKHEYYKAPVCNVIKIREVLRRHNAKEDVEKVFMFFFFQRRERCCCCFVCGSVWVNNNGIWFSVFWLSRIFCWWESINERSLHNFTSVFFGTGFWCYTILKRPVCRLVW